MPHREGVFPSHDMGRLMIVSYMAVACSTVFLMYAEPSVRVVSPDSMMAAYPAIMDSTNAGSYLANDWINGRNAVMKIVYLFSPIHVIVLYIYLTCI